MPREYPTVLDLVGKTPIVRLHRIGREVGRDAARQARDLNPGGSIKDRVGLAMIEEAERDGRLRPGGTIVEPTAGNTGVGLAMAAAAKGYRCIFVLPDKMSQEKIALLRAYGAEVVDHPTAVAPDSPESYYAVADRPRRGDPRRLQARPVLEPVNPETHYGRPGPEIWEQTDGELDVFVSRRRHGRHDLRRRPLPQGAQPGVKIVGADPEGSIYTADGASGPVPRRGHRQGHVADDLRPDVVDEYTRLRPRLVPHRAAAGARGGAARRRLRRVDVWAALKLRERLGPERAPELIPDSGRPYLSSCTTTPGCSRRVPRAARAAPTIDEVLRFKRGEATRCPSSSDREHKKVGEAIDLMQRTRSRSCRWSGASRSDSIGDVVGSLHERELLEGLREPGRAEGGRGRSDAAAARGGRSATGRSTRCTPTSGAAAPRSRRRAAAARKLTRSDLLEYLAHSRSEAWERAEARVDGPSETR